MERLCLGIDGWVEKCTFGYRWVGGWRDVCLDIDGWMDGDMYVWIYIGGWVKICMFGY